MNEIRQIFKDEYPYLLRRMTKCPPSLYVSGALPPDNYKLLCVVGSRSHSSYGKEACKALIKGLAGYPISIVSGLAIGIDSLAHKSAIDAGLHTIAFPGSSISPDKIYPRSEKELAQKIICSGGALVSPFNMDQEADRWTFPVRNQLMAGVSHAVLVIEAREKSGTSITVKSAVDLGRDVLVVPGSIFSELSRGSHGWLRDGAVAVSSAQDILEALGLSSSRDTIENPIDIGPRQNNLNIKLSEQEKVIIDKLFVPRTRDELIQETNLTISELNIALTRLEMLSIISESDGEIFLK